MKAENVSEERKCPVHGNEVLFFKKRALGRGAAGILGGTLCVCDPLGPTEAPMEALGRRRSGHKEKGIR